MPLSPWEERRKPETRQPDDARTPWDVDYARIVHSASFRRLQGKTQILTPGESDFYRTRLTHSLEVAQIAAGLVRQFARFHQNHPACPHLPDPALIQTIGFTHDLGHPPFGHGGEVALNYCMRDDGGFEGNGQTLRLLARLEKFSRQDGANLSRRSLLGVLKYPVAYGTVCNPDLTPALHPGPTSLRIIDRQRAKPPKCYLESEQDVVDWILAPLPPDECSRFQASDPAPGKHARSRHKSFDCSIMDMADDIAYGIHDFEDAVAVGMIAEEDFRQAVREEDCACFLTALKEKYPDKYQNNIYEQITRDLFAHGGSRKRLISQMVHHFIVAVFIDTLTEFDTPLLRYRAALPAPQNQFLKALKDLVHVRVIRRPSVQQLEFKGQTMIVSVFEAYRSDPAAFLPGEVDRLMQDQGSLRPLCDYIAGMTDGFLLKTYDRLFSPRMGSAFDRL